MRWHLSRRFSGSRQRRSRENTYNPTSRTIMAGWRSFIIASLLGFLSIAGVTARPAHLPNISQSIASEHIRAAYGHMMQGGLVMIELKDGVTLELDGEVVPQVNNMAVLGFDRDAPSNVQLRIFRQSGYGVETHSLSVKEQAYDVQYIDGLPPQYVSPPPEALIRIKAEAARKREARSNISQLAGFYNGFAWPVSGVITGRYGSQRFYNGEARRPHFGIDIAAPAGTPVVVAAPGRVSLAEPDMYFEGGLVFVDHGLGITSIYMHLGDISVSPGQWVEAGHVIGAVGSTGRSTGAHLDWRVQWRGRNIDPALLVPAMTVD